MVYVVHQEASCAPEVACRPHRQAIPRTAGANRFLRLPRQESGDLSHYFWVRISTSMPCEADATFQTVTCPAPAAASACCTAIARRPASTRLLLDARGSTTIFWPACVRPKSATRRCPEAVRLSEPDWNDADDNCKLPPDWPPPLAEVPLSLPPCSALVAASASRASLRASVAARACAAASRLACSASACACWACCVACAPCCCSICACCTAASYCSRWRANSARAAAASAWLACNMIWSCSCRS